MQDQPEAIPSAPSADERPRRTDNAITRIQAALLEQTAGQDEARRGFDPYDSMVGAARREPWRRREDRR